MGVLDKFETAATFDPEVFFNIILPPIIFNAGYSMKRKSFFKNFGSILGFAFLGTVISTLCTGFIVYGFLKVIRDNAIKAVPDLALSDCVFFGAIIAATDPVTVLAIFNELHVDVDLYALIFGESVMNDAVAIVLASTVEKYKDVTSLDATYIVEAVGNFLKIFCGSFGIGCLFGCLCAFLTKFTKLLEYPLLETSLVVLMSYSSFLAAEACRLTGIVAVLFCGICQAHYTYNNLSDDSQKTTKEFFELLNFFLENFIFSYIGVSVITMESQHFHVPFFFAALLAIFVGRALNIYPISFLLNLGRVNKIPLNHQHMMMFSGLRGAIAFALAIRNATTDARNVILSTTSLIVIVTVIFCGGLTSPMLGILNIRMGEDERSSSLAIASKKPPNYNTLKGESGENSTEIVKSLGKNYKKSWFHKWFGKFDVRFLKPLLTHSKPSLEEVCGSGCCQPIAKLFTTDRQRNHAIQTIDEDDATSWETRLSETPMHNIRAPEQFPNLTLEGKEPLQENADAGLEASNIIIDKDKDTRY